MLTKLNFDIPKSSIMRATEITGTVPAAKLGYFTISLNVTNSSTPSRNRSFYRVLTYDNSDSNTAQVVNTSCTLSIVPKLLGSDTVSSINKTFRNSMYRNRYNHTIFIRNYCCIN